MKLLTILLLVILTHSCMESNQVEFSPIFRIDETLVEKEPSDGFYSRLEQVLTYYDEEYSTNEKGIVLINEKLKNDKDLCWNYTTKANDSNWLSNH